MKPPPKVPLTQAVPPEHQPMVREFIHCLCAASEQGKVDIARAWAEWRRHWYGYSHKVRRRQSE